MYLKIIDGQHYQLIECKRVEFKPGHEGGNGWAEADGVTYPITGPAYILNDRGRTVDSFHRAPPLTSTGPLEFVICDSPVQAGLRDVPWLVGHGAITQADAVRKHARGDIGYDPIHDVYYPIDRKESRLSSDKGDTHI